MAIGKDQRNFRALSPVTKNRADHLEERRDASAACNQPKFRPAVGSVWRIPDDPGLFKLELRSHPHIQPIEMGSHSTWMAMDRRVARWARWVTLDQQLHYRVTLSRLAPYFSRLKSRISRIVAQKRESNFAYRAPAARGVRWASSSSSSCAHPFAASL
eukprot:SAG31_NODE_1479_length_8180_cov_7.141684_9_plen_158_part_00